jgi:hypothetical protein
MSSTELVRNRRRRIRVSRLVQRKLDAQTTRPGGSSLSQLMATYPTRMSGLS